MTNAHNPPTSMYCVDYAAPVFFLLVQLFILPAHSLHDILFHHNQHFKHSSSVQCILSFNRHFLAN